ncbi:TPA: transposase [bacterium]|nr:transposase [bacterium]
MNARGGIKMQLRKEKRIFDRMGFTDMRKQINGLAALAQDHKPEGPLDGSYFVFCGKSRRIIKILYWDATGFCLLTKRLERDTFPWPRNGCEFTELTRIRIRECFAVSMYGKNIKHSHISM